MGSLMQGKEGANPANCKVKRVGKKKTKGPGGGCRNRRGEVRIREGTTKEQTKSHVKNTELLGGGGILGGRKSLDSSLKRNKRKRKSEK